MVYLLVTLAVLTMYFHDMPVLKYTLLAIILIIMVITTDPFDNFNE